MRPELILNNARIVTSDEVICGSVLIRNGQIADIGGQSSLPGAQDLLGDYLLPGLVELHTDNLEKHMSPRPGVDWPSHSAIITHDAQMAASGITTVFDALSIGDISPRGERLKNLKPMMAAISSAVDDGLTRVDHHLHLRCEVAHPQTLNLFLELANEHAIGLVSVMDHSPGQRQFVHLHKYRTYYMGKYGLTEEEMTAFTARQIDHAARYSLPQREAICEYCRQHDLALASHDDANAAHVEESHALGMVIAEFPTTEEAAAASHQHGLKVLMGAPNIVRGGSHSGNVAAAPLAASGMLDVLSSDYYPASLLHAAMLLTKEDCAYDLPQAIRCVSKTPAAAVGLHDRGEIRPGLRADLVQMHMVNDHPVIRQVWRQGNRIF